MDKQVENGLRLILESTPTEKKLIEVNMAQFFCPESPDGARQMFNVRNNLHGRLFIAMLRKALNRKMYSIRVRGSQSDRVTLRKQGIYVSDQSVPLKHADRLRVYIDKLPEPRTSKPPKKEFVVVQTYAVSGWREEKTKIKATSLEEAEKIAKSEYFESNPYDTDENTNNSCLEITEVYEN